MIKRAIYTHFPYFLLSFGVYVVCFALGAGIFSQRLAIHPTSMEFGTTFGHNLLVGAILMVGGWLTLGMANTLYLAYNAAMFGVIVKGVMKGYGMQPLITGVVPHAVPEIIGHVLFCTLGYETWRFLQIIKKRARGEEETLYIRDILLLLVLAVVLLVISAWLESKVSHV
ncbi:hypothetical protein B9L19_14795 [Geobacillus thermocatenulatus]|uniref:Uncharacterized protein n=1 Tax=Geobacillus thermocatenulatus TaxID=33938 RepID=A0A226Q3A2_9BACL|nr:MULTISPECIES: stage II sporulation protein M [Geobacillus]AST00378.1 hypothetical protein GT3921_15900 [Geobacillus thermocatenulatus]KLR72380.1 hypothetical protein ABH20_16640 [Geobacillus sp. T6]OXB86755.1 hypothetical protein B9L19_14795 [Geobacillus thermocatenulatus]